jgi:hypothetical protein
LSLEKELISGSKNLNCKRIFRFAKGRLLDPEMSDPQRAVLEPHERVSDPDGKNCQSQALLSPGQNWKADLKI